MFDSAAFKGRLFEARNYLEGELHRDITWDELAERITDAHGKRTFKGPQVWDYEKGKVKSLPLHVVLAYAKACGVDPGWLAFGNPDSDASAPGKTKKSPVKPEPGEKIQEPADAYLADRKPKRRARGAGGKGAA